MKLPRFKMKKKSGFQEKKSYNCDLCHVSMKGCVSFICHLPFFTNVEQGTRLATRREPIIADYRAQISQSEAECSMSAVNS